MDSKWKYQGRPFQGPSEGDWGFTYKVTEKLTGNYYYGQKAFWSVTNPRISKKKSELLWSGRGRKPTRERNKRVESTWKTYCTSSATVKGLAAEFGEDAFEWEILEIFDSKTELCLGEVFLILNSGCLCDPKCYNKSIKINIYSSNLNCNK